jgi:branched-chain amino acid transport system substrate-binding protein
MLSFAVAMRRLVAVLIALFAGLSLAGCEASTEAQKDNVVRIGALNSFSGVGSNLGRTARAALEVSVDDFNAFLLTAGSEMSVELDTGDTQSDPTRALQLMEEMADRGIRIIVGPQTSSEALALLPRANEIGMILLSPSAVAKTLSIPNDNLFRMVTDLTVQGEANAEYLKSEGITKLIVVRTGEVWGSDLLSATRTKYEAGGGSIVTEMVYTTSTETPAETSAKLAVAVANAVAAHGKEAVGVALFSLGEGVEIIREAAKVPALAEVKWIGSSALGRDVRLLAETPVVEFLQKVGMPCAVFGIDAQAEPFWSPISAKVKAKVGRDADSYSLAAYDGLWLAAYTIMDAGSDDPETLRNVLMHNSTTYFGATGWTAMNANGDRKASNFDFWSVRSGFGGVAEWYRSAAYEQSGGGYVLRKF